MIWAVLCGLAAIFVGGFLFFRHVHVTWLACVLFFWLIVGIALTGLSALGSPIPLSIAQYWLPEKIVVAGYQFREGVAIDILVGGPSPLLVTLPWSEPKAAALQRGGEAAKARHANLMASVPALLGKPGHDGAQGNGKKKGAQGNAQDGTPSDEGLAFPEPPAALPPKTGES